MVKGILGAAKRYVFNRIDSPAVVLLYHRVTKLQTDPQLLAVAPDNFCEQVNHLKKKYTLLGIEEFYDFLSRKKKFPRKSVIITFDDGYADNLHEALPILESLSAQALFYITTSNLDTDRELWWDELERIWLHEREWTTDDSIHILDTFYVLKAKTVEERMNAYRALLPVLRGVPPIPRNQIIDHLRSMAGIGVEGRPTHRVMTWEELQKMSHSSSAVIGAHTHNHPSLVTLKYKEQEEEIRISKEALEKITGKKMEHFSYPYGTKADFNEDSIRACLENGFKMVCANYYDQVHTWTDKLQVPRVLVRDWNLEQFSQFMKKSFSY